LMPTTEEVIAALEASGVSALLLTHPSYEGVTIDLVQVADYCRQHDIALAVDEAHGSHFPFLDDQWPSAIATPADIVTHSMHKYTGSLVQTALLHLPTGSRFTVEQVMGVLTLFEATTRSNLLILSIEDAIKRGFSEEGRHQFWQATWECDRLRSQLDGYGTVLTYDSQVSDPLKIVLKSDRVSGTELAELLYERGIDGEFADEEGVLLICSFNHTQNNFQFMRKVFAELALSLKQKAIDDVYSRTYFSRCPQITLSPQDAFFKPKEKRPLHQSIGRISGCCIKKVPPGSPLLIPGEKVTDWHLKHLSADIIVEVVRED
ncbi:MAG: decarboxylase, partial [Merismopedia sp. SIO2A8]|nr:decarboxylase [Merismopedia sp. SIO2A8]